MLWLAFASFGVLVPFFYYNVFGKVEHAGKFLWEIQVV